MSNSVQTHPLKHKLKTNRHEVFVLSIDAFDAILKESGVHFKQSDKNSWEKHKSKIGGCC
ncbi:hypothetical protein [Kangiella geojedonensis]|uniref:Uncharacterized protein n=1 Tax=Kangiella geojedonensis TaxID=914150 RepID=A0A0F6RCZ9_9GAMM|nr:hypothetical protein [Kangiella geojedonensis]AKE52491.1 hypothetical protein TQ33_1545 [Kangiella geojedonensis]